MSLLAGLGTEDLVGIALGGLTIVLVGPGPLWVRRWRFLVRVPRAAVVLWQAGAVGALVAVALSAVVVAPLSQPEPDGVRGQGLALTVFDTVVVLFAALVYCRLLWALVCVAAQTSARRRRHRAAVDLLGVPLGGPGLAGLLVLDGARPLAYCIPGVRGSRVILSRAALDVLAADELTAVLEHERAHLRARHDLVLDMFVAVHRAFPLLVRSEIPAEQCRLLVEMLADDAAVRRTGPLPLVRALATLAGAEAPHDALPAAGSALDARLDRLCVPADAARRLSAAVYLLSVALVVSPVALWFVAAVLR